MSIASESAWHLLWKLSGFAPLPAATWTTAETILSTCKGALILNVLTRTAFGALLLFLAAAQARAAAPDKRPGDLTLEEHIAQRLDAGQLAAGNKAFTSGPTPVVIVTGNINPGAFMPTELFRNLLLMACESSPALQKAYRHRLDASAVALGFGRDFWPALDAIVQPLVLEESGDRSGQRVASPHHAQELCALRASTLDQVYARFGAKRVQSLLYQAVTPGMSMTVDPVDADHLRFVEGGCR